MCATSPPTASSMHLLFCVAVASASHCVHCFAVITLQRSRLVLLLASCIPAAPHSELTTQCLVLWPCSNGSNCTDPVNGVLAITNQLRTLHGSGNLTWSSTLAASAQAWANNCQFAHSSACCCHGVHGARCSCKHYSHAQVTASAQLHMALLWLEHGRSCAAP